MSVRVTLAGCLAVSVAVAVAAVLFAGWRQASPAFACSIAPSTLEGDAEFSDWLALVRVIEVGGAANEQPLLPTVTPTATFAPFESPTSLVPDFDPPTRTHTPEGTPTDTPTPYPTSTPFPEPDLTGMRATLRPLETYFGAPGDSVTVDAARRKQYEQDLRKRQAGYFPSICGPFAAPSYTLGARYLVAGKRFDGEAYSLMLVPVDGADAVLPEHAGFYMQRPVYDRYFRGVDAEFYDSVFPEGEIHTARTRARRIPVQTIVRAFLGVRAGEVTPEIIGPETGNAGLAAAR